MGKKKRPAFNQGDVSATLSEINRRATVVFDFSRLCLAHRQDNSALGTLQVTQVCTDDLLELIGEASDKTLSLTEYLESLLGVSPIHSRSNLKLFESPTLGEPIREEVSDD